MRRLVLSLAVAVVFMELNASAAQSTACNGDKQFPGAYLRWLEIAKPVFQQKHLNLEKYNIVFLDLPDSMTVLLRSTDATCEGFGSTGSRPDFEVAISKKDFKVMHSEYVR
jgi:hypothetical protein